MKHHQIIIVAAMAALFMYALAYTLMSDAHFSQKVTPMDGIYLSTLLVTTCGTDDIKPITATAKLVCCSEMIIGFLITMHVLSLAIIGLRTEI